jgi:hypothetical protein
MRLKPASFLVKILQKEKKKKRTFCHKVVVKKQDKKTKSLTTSSQIATIAYNLNIIYYHILTIAKFD